MDFINSPVALESLPKVEEASLKPIHPAYLKILRLEWLITSIILAAIAAVLIFTVSSLKNSYGWMIMTAAVLIFLGAYYFFQEKGFPFKQFAVRDKDVLYQKGWLIQTLTICPFNRIQNCSVQTGPLERRHGLASLIIYTAGSGGADLRIPGLLQEEADKLRHFILEKIHKEANEEF